MLVHCSAARRCVCGRVGAVYGVREAAYGGAGSVLAGSDGWRCVLCVHCVGSLYWNDLGEEAGKAIGAALQHTPNLQRLE